jgi:hypothetical protein
MKLLPFENLLDADDRHHLILIRRDLLKFCNTPNSQLHVSDKLLFMTVQRLDKILGRPGRLAFLTWVFRQPVDSDPPELSMSSRHGMHRHDIDNPITSSKDLQSFEAMGLLVWAGPHKKDGALAADPWQYSPHLDTDLRLIALAFTGQRPLVIPLSNQRPMKIEEDVDAPR